ncbi:hypothetical protein [Brucella pituitosa]|uniref:Uncharacterized protein n=1 Tax=Brucella pituitosa TaxID=571256 RepID=A0ABS3K4G7_9HYPH|nr:hypothetical protein [Brucella pituitosa]MBO1040686.1 hypothetical protein [Brucella pituitosa]
MAQFQSAHISYAYLFLVIIAPAAYFRVVQFHSSSQKLNSKRGTPPPSRAFQISPLRTPPPSEAGFLVFSAEFCLFQFHQSWRSFFARAFPEFFRLVDVEYAIAAGLSVVVTRFQR